MNQRLHFAADSHRSAKQSFSGVMEIEERSHDPLIQYLAAVRLLCRTQVFAINSLEVIL